MMAINRYRLKHLSKQGHPAAKRVQKLLSRPDKLLSTILIGNTFATLLYSSFFTQFAMDRWGELNIGESLLLTLCTTLILLVCAESTPKIFAALYAQTVAFGCSRLLQLTLWILYPLVWFIAFLGYAILKTFGVKIPKHHKHHDPLSYEELRTMVQESGEHLPSQNKSMLIRLIDLTYTRVQDVMIPRNDIQGIDLSDPWETNYAILTDHTDPYLLVYQDNIQNTRGFIETRHILKLLSQQILTAETLSQNLTDCYFIPESTTLADQLIHFQNNQKQIGLVVDEYGEILGLLSLQHVLEEVIGEFTHPADLETEITPQEDGTFLIDGTMNLRDINRRLLWRLPTRPGPKTLAGLIIEHLELIPDGPVCLKISGYKMETGPVQNNTIKTVRVFPKTKKSKSKMPP